jgi:glycolate oxidase FAD binding subunit
MIRAQASPHEISAAAHLPALAAARSAVDFVAAAGGAVTAIRIEGPGPSVEHRCAALRRELKDFGPTEELHSLRSGLFWREVRDVAPLLREPARILWRLSVPPARGAEIMAAIAMQAPSFLGRGGGGRDAAGSLEHYFDWGGGLIWLALPPGDDAAAAAIRGAVARGGGGHATLMRAPHAVRLAVPVFEPLPDGLAALSSRVKEAFDPHRILNPGRMAADL